VEAEYLAALKASYWEARQNVRVRQAAFTAQQNDSGRLYWLVMAVTGIGLLLSVVQFGIAAFTGYHAARQSNPARRQSRHRRGVKAGVAAVPAEPAGHEDAESAVELSLTGVTVRSSVIGLVILTVSFGFFYLYLTQVFTIAVLK
jgi:hypothetical protein